MWSPMRSMRGAGDLSHGKGSVMGSAGAERYECAPAVGRRHLRKSVRGALLAGTVVLAAFAAVGVAAVPAQGSVTVNHATGAANGTGTGTGASGGCTHSSTGYRFNKGMLTVAPSGCSSTTAIAAGQVGS